ncbi:MAG: hypothetical protein IK102_10910 [Treponema sp.]|nr:hypothetical protein [Treponema sp.]
MKKRALIVLAALFITSLLPAAVLNNEQSGKNSKIVVTGYIISKGNDPFPYPAIILDSGEELQFICNKKMSRQLLSSQEHHVQLTLEKTKDDTLVLKKWKKLKK